MTTPKLTTVLFLAGALTAVHAQGPLAPPPGAPAPGMKTLTQIEPRTDLTTVPGNATYVHVINQSGSYYLSGNLDVATTSGIQIAASGVTLDLNGFSILRSSASAATGTAIVIAGGLANIWIKNGHITSGVTYNSGASGDQFTGSGFAYGIRENSFPDPENVRVSHLHVSGCDLDGINLGPRPSNTVEHCSVRVAGGLGIRAGEVHHSTAINCGSTAIQAAGNVSHSRGESVGTTGIGIIASGNVSNSYGISSGGSGISTSGNVSNSYGMTTGTGTSSDGISASGNISNSYGQSSGGNGIESFFGNVSNSRGQTAGGDGIVMFNFRTISFSHGSTTGTGVGLKCHIAIGCTSSGGVAINNKYLMP